MKRKNNEIILIFLFIIFILLFKFNGAIRESVIDSCVLWFYKLVPSMTIMYFITDLLINYGLVDFMYKIFKNNRVILFLISALLGTPANAKYISEFYSNKYISLEEANSLLMCSYSPNPLFIISIAPDKKYAILTLAFIYSVNLIIYIFTKKRIKKSYEITYNKTTSVNSKCLELSIFKTFKLLILILGIVIVFGVLNKIVDIMLPNSIFIRIILEMTNALNIISNNRLYFKFFPFACAFGGLSIHMQIKSILEDTPMSYKYFLLGRIIESILALFFTICL